MPIRPEVAAAEQAEHLCRPRAGLAERRSQAATLFGAHRPVVEVEGETPDVALFPIANVSIGPTVGRAVTDERDVRHAA
jgi:hypothetical protein